MGIDTTLRACSQTRRPARGVP